MTEDELSNTGNRRVRDIFGPSWRGWAWVQRQFTPTSLGAIGFLIISCGTYIVHLRESVVEVTTRVIVLEKEVIPVIQDENVMTSIKDAVASQNERLARLENNWDHASIQAATAPVVRKPRRR